VILKNFALSNPSYSNPTNILKCLQIKSEINHHSRCQVECYCCWLKIKKLRSVAIMPVAIQYACFRALERFQFKVL